jgi:hypothetical protein
MLPKYSVTHIGTGADKVKLKSPSRTTVMNNR